jgi:AcrR family transcriptional regulator
VDPKELRERTVKDAKCGVILDAARRVLLEKGYLNTRLEDIAAAAGFSKPSLYSYYDDKESILFSLAIRELQGVLDKIDALVAARKGFVQTLREMLHMVFVSFGEQHEFVNTAVGLKNMRALHMNMSKHERLGLQFEETMGRFSQTMVTILERARASGEILSKVDTSAMALYILCLIQGVQAQALLSGQLGETNVVVDQIMEFIEHGVVLSGKDKGRA